MNLLLQLHNKTFKIITPQKKKTFCSYFAVSCRPPVPAVCRCNSLLITGQRLRFPQIRPDSVSVA